MALHTTYMCALLTHAGTVLIVQMCYPLDQHIISLMKAVVMHNAKVYDKLGQLFANAHSMLRQWRV